MSVITLRMGDAEMTSKPRCAVCKGTGIRVIAFREWADDVTPVLSTIRVPCRACAIFTEKQQRAFKAQDALYNETMKDG